MTGGNTSPFINLHPHQRCSSGTRVFSEGVGSVSLQRDADAGPLSLEVPAHTLTLTAVRLPQATSVCATSPLSLSYLSSSFFFSSPSLRVQHLFVLHSSA
ncbi:hypothetical protein AMECASPLE_006570 [Ameca splendens]|uniref:Uncharacterized protein n=1 Tax=Ameca splendens TaxID=208324 RepID=A0ABV0YLV1_9TELE